jgi:DNA (cytosine-5)-methyltransferase 1|tara:strand:- start:341 stop:1399 length:1059 start_codon:yes stop_codon:yes gene_type:complete
MVKTALSLFSGCGGDTVGMNNAGLDVSWYSELKNIFRESHDLNFDTCKLLGSDINKIPDKDFENLKGTIDIIFGGFPCQSFSNAGKKDPNDTRGQLYLQFIRAAKLIRPKFIIGENVKGLQNRKTETGENFIDVIIKAFNEIGYTCVYKVLKAEEYGVPQKRERLFIVGCLDENFKLEWPEPDNERVSLENIVKFDMEGALQVPKELMDEAGVPESAMVLGEGESYGKIHPYLISQEKVRGVVYKEKYISKYQFSYSKRKSPVHCEIVDITKPSKTIICAYDHQPRLYVPLKTSKGYFIRPFTISELQQIQGFPYDYKLSGSYKDKVVQIGNAIPPKLVQSIIDKIKVSETN